MIELKPCPFCGKPMTVRYSSRYNAFQFYHADDDARCCVLLEPISFKALPMIKIASLADAVAAWNRRADNGARKKL